MRRKNSVKENRGKMANTADAPRAPSRTPRAPRVIVNVTQEMIDRSMVKDSSHCMIAETVRAAVPSAQYVAVDIQTIRFSDPKRRLRYTYLTPRIAQVPIVQFDQ